jgi:hypothetical protein
MRRALSCGSAGSFEAKIEMKILLSTPGTIAMARRAASAAHAVGSESQSIPRQLDEPGSCCPDFDTNEKLARTSRFSHVRRGDVTPRRKQCQSLPVLACSASFVIIARRSSNAAR